MGVENFAMQRKRREGKTGTTIQLQAMLDDNDKQWIRTEMKAELGTVLNHVLSEIGRRAEEQTARWESIDAG